MVSQAAKQMFWLKLPLGSWLMHKEQQLVEADISAYQSQYGMDWIDQPNAIALPSAVGASDRGGTSRGRTSTRAWAALSSFQLGGLDICWVCPSKEGELSDGEDS